MFGLKQKISLPSFQSMVRVIGIVKIFKLLISGLSIAYLDVRRRIACKMFRYFFDKFYSYL